MTFRTLERIRADNDLKKRYMRDRRKIQKLLGTELAIDILRCAADLAITHNWSLAATHASVIFDGVLILGTEGDDAFVPLNPLDAATWLLGEGRLYDRPGRSRWPAWQAINRALRHICGNYVNDIEELHRSRHAAPAYLEAAAFLEDGEATFDTKAIPPELSEALFWTSELTHDNILEVLAHLATGITPGERPLVEELGSYGRHHWLLPRTNHEFTYLAAHHGSWHMPKWAIDTEVNATQIDALAPTIFKFADQRYADLVEQLPLRMADAMMARVKREDHFRYDPTTQPSDDLKAAGIAQIHRKEDEFAAQALRETLADATDDHAFIEEVVRDALESETP